MDKIRINSNIRMEIVDVWDFVRCAYTHYLYLVDESKFRRSLVGRYKSKEEALLKVIDLKVIDTIEDIKKNVIVPQWLMNRIAAMCDVTIDNSDDTSLVKTAKAIRAEINKGFECEK